jgi:hypothetical protein
MIPSAPDNTIPQARGYLQVWGWDEWKNCTQDEYNEILQYIEAGGKYQLRTLTESSRVGYEIPVKHKKICEHKIDGHCPLHNLFCAYPKCEEE